MKQYLVKDRHRKAQDVTATHATVTELTRKVEGRGHKLFMDSLLSFLDLFNDLTKKNLIVAGL
jgi:hypothetical protein